MKTAYLDAFSGLSGDMLVGALLDTGADFEALKLAVAQLGMGGYRLSTRRKVVSGISAAKFAVEVLERQQERHLGEIATMIEAARRPSAATDSATRIFTSLAQTEATVLGAMPTEG